MLSDHFVPRFSNSYPFPETHVPQDNRKNNRVRRVCRAFAAAMLLAMLALITSTSHAADVTLGWDPNSENDVEGYGVYFSQDDSGPPYTLFGYVALNEMNDPGSPSFTITGLEMGARYFFAVTAYDTSGNESAYSNSVCADVGDVITPCPSSSVGGDGGSSGGAGGGSSGGGCFIGSAENNHARFHPGIHALTVLACMGMLLWIGRMRFRRSPASLKHSKPKRESEK